MRSTLICSVVTAVTSVTLLAGCGSNPPPLTSSGPVPLPSPPPAAGPVVFKTTLADVGLDEEALDKSADPCVDFYQFACGGWSAKTPIPGDEAAWMRSFDEIRKRNDETLKGILDEAAKGEQHDPGLKKLGDFYGACMDEASVDAAGTKPIDDLLRKARRVSNTNSVATLLAELHLRRIWALFDVSAAQDFKDATLVIANLDQNGLGLPDRDYYIVQDEKKAALRKGYVEHIERMMRLAGSSPAAAKRAAADVLQLETEIAKISKTRVERRDPKGLYNKVSRKDLHAMTRSFPWDTYLQGIGRADIRELNVTSIPFFEGLGSLLSTVRPSTWQNYLTWTVIRATAQVLPKPFVDESFALRALLTGQKEQQARWKRCVAATDRAMGELLAQPFIKARFGGDSKEGAQTAVSAISKAFARDVQGLAWMDPATKQRATDKLSAMAYLIGFPNRWKSYDFDVLRGAHGANALAARAFETRRDLAKIDKPLDRDEWQMSPPTVNAYYDPQRNHMVFPAGILQPPFFSAKASMVVNLGAIGVVVGHELTHGFDDQGAQFDGKGNLADWWEPKTGEEFKTRTQCVEDQYAAYEALPGLKLNGKLTLGENIADLGGVKLAFHAYRAVRAGAAEVTEAGGFSEDQQFFLAHGQSWCGNFRDEILRLLVQTNPHSPPRFRVNGPLSNMPEFAEAFACKPGAPMRPKNVCSVW